MSDVPELSTDRTMVICAGTATLIVLILAGMFIAGVRIICARQGAEFGPPLLAGGAAGFVLHLFSLPFVVKLAVMPAGKERDNAFWVLWGAGFLMRLFCFGVLALVLNWMYRGFEMPSLLAMVAIYLPGLFIETAWLARRFITVELDKHG